MRSAPRAGLQDGLADLALRASFGEERSVHDRQTQFDVAVAAGPDEAEVVAVLDDLKAYTDEVRSDEREAVELGARGGPFVALDRHHGVGGVQSAGACIKALELTRANRSAA